MDMNQGGHFSAHYRELAFNTHCLSTHYFSIYKTPDMAWAQGSEISGIAFLLGVCGVLVSTLGIGDQMSWISIYG